MKFSQYFTVKAGGHNSSLSWSTGQGNLHDEKFEMIKMLENLENGMVAMEQRLDSLYASLQVASAVVTEYLEVLMELQRICGDCILDLHQCSDEPL